jgi:hypothetical protein
MPRNNGNTQPKGHGGSRTTQQTSKGNSFGTRQGGGGGGKSKGGK